MRRSSLALAIIVVLAYARVSAATTYAVKSDGTGNYITIAACAAVAVAGDTCEVYDLGSAYAGWTQPSSGSNGSPITFKAHTGDTPTINSTITLTTRSYITIGAVNGTETVGPKPTSLGGFKIVPASGNGIVGRPSGGGAGATHVIVQNTYLEVHGGWALYWEMDASPGVNSPDNTIQFNEITHTYGASSGSESLYFYGDRWLVQGNYFHDVCQDFIKAGGTNVVIRNNQLLDADPGKCGQAGNPAYHLDGTQVTGLNFTQSLYEGNTLQNSLDSSGNAHFLFMRNTASASGPIDGVIIRYNYGQKVQNGALQTGGSAGDTAQNNRIYFNTVAWEVPANCATGCGAIAWCIGGGTCTTNNGAVNNIWMDDSASGNGAALESPSGGTNFFNSNIAFDCTTRDYPCTTPYGSTWTAPYSSEATYATLRNLDPQFANYPSSASLKSTSPARAAGVHLTTVANTDTGSGTSLIVNDAAFFQALTNVGPSGAVQGDWIRVGASTTVQVTAVNYSTNTLTLASGITRSIGDNIDLYKKSDGVQVLFDTLPDIGAVPFNPNPVGAGPNTNTIKRRVKAENEVQ